MPKKAITKEQEHKCVWVKKNTGLEIQVSEVNNLIDPIINEFGVVIEGKYLNDDASLVELELVSKEAQTYRAQPNKIWVYKDTSITYNEPFDLQQLTNTKKKNGLTSAGTLDVGGEIIFLELISKGTRRGRREVWVYKGTSILYTEPFDLQQLINTKRKNGLIYEGTLDLGGNPISLELISKNAQRKRTELWVYKGTCIPYTELFNFDQLANTKIKNGLISEGTLDVGGEAISLEFISKNAQILRQKIWVYKGTSIPYTELFDPDQLINPERKNDLITAGALDVDGNPILLELISKSTQKQRSEVWVYKGTSIPCTEPFNLDQLKNTKIKNGLISEGSLDVGDDSILLELIPKSRQRVRQNIWVYKGTRIPYTEPFDLDQLKNPEIKNGFISAGTLHVNGEIIQLEFITQRKKTHSKNSSSHQGAQTESINNNEAEFEEMDIDSMITPELISMINQVDSEQSTYPTLPIDEEDLARPTLKRKSDAFEPNPAKKISTFFGSHKNIPKDVVQENPSNKLSF